MKQFRGIRLFFYNLSAAGLALILTLVVSGSLPFFHPATETMKAGMPRFLAPVLFGSLPLLAVFFLAGMLLRAAALPVAASLSDRSLSPFGRRRVFLFAAPLPLACSALLLFLTPVPGLYALNMFLLVLFGGVFFISRTAYTVPYLALIPDFGATESDRLFITASQGLAGVVGALIAFAGLPLMTADLAGQNAAGNYQMSVLVFVLIGAVILAAAPLAVREKTAGNVAPPKGSLGETLRTVFEIKHFKGFLASDGAVWFALAVFLVSASAIGGDLMLVDPDSTRTAVVAFLVAAALAVPAVWWVTKTLGKRRVMIIATAVLAVSLALLSAAGAFPNPGGLRWNCVTSITETADGKIVFGTWRGASVFDGREWTSITRENGLIDDRVTSVVGTPDGLWFGTLGGASFYDGNRWTHYSKASGLIDNQVLSVIPRGEGVWFLTPKGISHLENADFPQYVPETAGEAGAAAPLTSFVLGDLGDLWAGTEDGAFRFSESGWTEYGTDNGLPDGTVTSLATAPNGDVLVGTYKGLARFSPTTREWNVLDRGNGLPSDTVLRVKTAGDELFVCTGKGVYVSGKNNNHRTLTAADGLAHDRVTDVLAASDGTVWFATGNGVSAFSNGLWTTYQYPLPRIWGIICFILLGLAAAAVLVLSPLFTAEQAAGANTQAMFFAEREIIRSVAVILGVIAAAVFFSAFAQSVADPLGIRLLLLIGAVAAGLALIGFFRYPESLSGDTAKTKAR